MKSIALQNRRVWIAGGVLVAFLIIAASWLLLINPKFASARELRSQAEAAQLQASQLSAKVRKMAEQDEHFGALKAKLAAALEALPTNSGLPAFTREVAKAAEVSHVTVSSIAVGTVSPVVAALPTSVPTTTTPSAPDSASSTAAPVPAATTSAATNQFTIAVTLTSTGKLAAQTRFLNLVEHGARRVLVSSSDITAGSTSAAPGSKAGQAVGNTVDTSATMTTSLTLFTSTMSPGQFAVVQRLLAASS